MIPNDSFLRNVPSALDPKTRIELEAIAFSIDSIGIQHTKVYEWAAKRTPETFTATTREEQIELFLSLWSIIDLVHALRQLLKQIQTQDEAKQFFALSEAATHMRNQMDHLHQNIDNIGKKKGRINPVFGVFSFGQSSLDSENINIESVDIFTITAGSFTHQKHEWPIPTPTPGKIIAIPVGMFEFSAFEKTVDISSLILSLHSIVMLFDTKVKDHIHSELSEYAKKSGEDLGKLLSEHTGFVTTVLKTKLMDQTEN